MAAQDDLERAPYWFSAFPFPPGHFMVHRVRGREAISKPYVFDVTVTASTLLGDNVEQLAVGHRASLVIRVGSKPRVIPGVIDSVRAEGLRESGRAAQATFRLVPMVALLKYQRGSRIFQDMRVHQVVDKVLHAAGIATRWDLTRKHPVRDYITQYEESDLAFVQRLIAESGIFYTFGSSTNAAAGLVGAIADAIGNVAADFTELAAAAAGSVSHPTETLFFGDDASTYPTIAMSDADELLEDVAAAVGLSAELAAGPLTLNLGKAPSLAFMSVDGLTTARNDKVTHFVSTRRVRSDVAEYREFDPARPNTPLISRVGDPRSLAASVADAASAGVGGSLGAAAASIGGAVSDVASTAKAALSDPLSAVGSFASGAIADTLLGLIAQRRLETYEHHAYFLHPDLKEVEGVASRVRRRTTRKRVTAQGEGGCYALAAGHRFRLEDHPYGEHNREYVVISVEHRGDVAKTDAVYENSFTCVPADVTYAPSPGKRRTVQAFVTATVVGPAGEDIYTDAGGRIKVHFHWDRRGIGPDTSCWIRTVHPWAGAGFGHQFIPRIGMEVAVVFEGGDPDKPIVQGCLYNGTHPTPFALPANKTQSGIRTQSTPGGGGSNELMFEDAARRELIYLHAQRDYQEEVNHDHTVLIKNDETVHVQANRRDDVGNNASYEVHANREDIVHGDTSVHHFGSRIDVVEKALDQRVTGIRTTRLENQDQLDVRGKAEHRYESDRTTRVIGNDTYIVGKHEAPRSLTIRVEGVASISAENVLELASAKGITLRCGKTSIRIGEDGIEIQGGTVRVAGEKGSFEAGKEGLTFKSEKAHVHFAEKVLLKTEGASLAMGNEVKVDGAQILFNSPEKAKDKAPPDPKPPTEIVLKDAETGKPLPNERFVVELEDGAQRTGVTDDEGRAKVALPSSGQVRFSQLSRVTDENGNGGSRGSGQAWIPYVVQQGDHLAKLAFRFGTDADTLWAHSDNAELARRRKNRTTLAPGDVLFVPSQPAPSLRLRDGTTNTYRAVIPKVPVTLRLGSRRESLANQSYEIHGTGGSEPLRGTTSEAGELSFEVPVPVREVTIVLVELGMRIPVRLGDLDPLEEDSGIVQRLANLGYLPSAQAISRESLANALRMFQHKHRLATTGVLDQATRDSLKNSHLG